MKALITGISGFVGSHLAEYLLEPKNVQLFGTFINEEELANIRHIKNKVNLLKCDIQDFQRVSGIISKVNPDHVYHFAAISSGAEEDREKVFSVNVNGTINVLGACRKIDKKVKILLASTGYVYGSSEKCAPFTEESGVNPVGIYAESKLEMEKQALKFLSDDIKIIVMRAFNHTGPRQTPDFVVPAFAKQIAEIEKGTASPELYVGNLEAVRDFLDVRDVVKAYKLVLEKGKSKEIYNVASGEGIRIHDILEKLLTLSSKKISIKQDDKRLRPSDIACSVGSFKKIKNELGWEPQISLEKTLADTLYYWRKII
jgi:GDP-4-dehydro-6-deoxy-D-mannose reductase